MSEMIKMLTSSTIESEQRQIARLKRSIENLNYELQMRELNLERLKNKDSPLKIVAAPSGPEIREPAEIMI
jgi:hypothetical protein